MSNHLFEALREPLREYIPDDQRYDETFDWFEYLLCLVHCDLSVTREDLEKSKAKDPGFTLWASVGRFGWKHEYGDEGGIVRETELHPGQSYPERIAAVVRAGFFESAGQHDDKFREVKAAFDRLLAKVRAECG